MGISGGGESPGENVQISSKLAPITSSITQKNVGPSSRRVGPTSNFGIGYSAAVRKPYEISRYILYRAILAGDRYCRCADTNSPAQ